MMILSSPVPLYVGKELAKFGKRASMELSIEWPLICDKWRYIVFGLAFQYIHGVGAKSAHYLHHPGPILHDIGFQFLPELGKERAFWSEWLFLSVVLPFVLWTFRPFFFNNKKFYTALMWPKILMILCICQLCRMASFTATQLPGPNYHCREGSPMATLPPPKHVLDIFLLDMKKAGMFGCGDLIFSSHMTFSLTAVLIYSKYGSVRLIKGFSWLVLLVQSLLIIASRKHYSVDVVVAWYTVPLVFYFVDHALADHTGQFDSLDLRMDRLADRSSTAPLLPTKADVKDGRTNGTLAGGQNTLSD